MSFLCAFSGLLSLPYPLERMLRSGRAVSLRPIFHLAASVPEVLDADECFLKNILDQLHDSSANSI